MESLSKRRKAPLVPAPWAFSQHEEHHRTWALPLLLILGFLSAYTVQPTESNPIHHFLFLSYKLIADDGGVPGPPSSRPTHYYGKGPWDMAFICFYTIFLLFTREFCMHELLRPLAGLCGIASRAKRLRFAEQMYTALYIAVVGPWGLYVMKHTPVWYFNTTGMYEGFPHKLHDADFKAYYLVQAAFWLQQVVVMVLGLEERRKDFKELVAHHIVTVFLIALSYCFHFTYIGIAVYVTHDISDLFLAMSKSLNYAGSKLQAPTFVLCFAMWVYLRHYLNLVILYSMLPGAEFSTVGPYEFDWSTQQYKGPLANSVTFGLLASLQVLNLFWLYCLIRSAYRFAFRGIARDDRSEAEEEKQEDQDMEGLAKQNKELVKDTVDAKAGAMLPHANGNGHVPRLVQRNKRV